MKRQSIFATAAVIVAALALAWLLVVVLLRRSVPATRGSAAAPAGTSAAKAPTDATPTAGRTITVRLLAVAADGLHLDTVQQEVPYANDPVEQATAILDAEFALGSPLVSAIPKGTSLNALYITNKGDAYVDLSPEISQDHLGGTTAELLTVYSIVDVLTMNLPAINGVQILVDGQEVDTLAGHVDLRRPLQKDPAYLTAAGAAATSKP